MKIALYTLYDSGPRVGEWDDWQDSDSDYVRMSEVVEIDLPLLPDAETAPKRIKALDRMIESRRLEAAARIAPLEEKKSKLMAIPYLELVE